MTSYRTASKVWETFVTAGIPASVEYLAGGYYGTLVSVEGARILVALPDSPQPTWTASVDDETGLLGHGDSVDLGRCSLRELPSRLLENAQTILSAPRI